MPTLGKSPPPQTPLTTPLIIKNLYLKWNFFSNPNNSDIRFIHIDSYLEFGLSQPKLGFVLIDSDWKFGLDPFRLKFRIESDWFSTCFLQTRFKRFSDWFGIFQKQILKCHGFARIEFLPETLAKVWCHINLDSTK